MMMVGRTTSQGKYDNESKDILLITLHTTLREIWMKCTHYSSRMLKKFVQQGRSE